jgi:hypothetical protein
LPLVPDAAGSQAREQRFPSELRMAAGAWEPPDVDQRGHARVLQDREEGFARSGTVPNSQNNGHRSSLGEACA